MRSSINQQQCIAGQTKLARDEYFPKIRSIFFPHPLFSPHKLICSQNLWILWENLMSFFLGGGAGGVEDLEEILGNFFSFSSFSSFILSFSPLFLLPILKSYVPGQWFSFEMFGLGNNKLAYRLIIFPNPIFRRLLFPSSKVFLPELSAPFIIQWMFLPPPFIMFLIR